MIILAGLMTLLAGGVTALVCFANGMRSTPGIFQGGSLILFAWFIAFAFWFAALAPVHAHDHGRTDQNWEEMSPEERDWIRDLKQPDNPSLSCCGESDQYWCDIVYTRGGKTYCRITDDRDDARFNRPHIPIGTEIEIPNHKLKWDRGNPTGHAVVFVTRSLYVHCFVQGTGI